MLRETLLGNDRGQVRRGTVAHDHMTIHIKSFPDLMSMVKGYAGYRAVVYETLKLALPPGVFRVLILLNL